MLKGASDRWQYIRELCEQRAYYWIVAAISLAWTGFSLWREHWATPAQQEATRFNNILTNWEPSWWIAISLALVLLWLFEASFLRQRPGLQLKYDRHSYGRAIHADKPLGYTTCITVINGTAQTLERCQVQLQITTRNGVKCPADARFIVSEPFTLRPDEHRAINVLEYEFDTPNAPMVIHLLLETANGWQEFPTPLTLQPGHHEIVVEAIATGSRIAKLPLHLSNKNDRWHINGHSTAGGQPTKG